MSQPDLLTDILQSLDAQQWRYAELDRYFTGTQDLAFMCPESKIALGSRFGRMASNIPRLAVTSLSERLRISGITGADVWPEWQSCDMEMLATIAHTECLLLGNSYICVWAAPDGSPRVTVESARQVAVRADPGSREIVAAAKRWYAGKSTHVMLYLPDRIEHYVADTPGAVDVGFDLIDVVDNRIGTVPICQLHNADRIPIGGVAYPERLLQFGHSEVWDLIPLVDAVNKEIADMLVASEYSARPRRIATGVQLTEVPRVDSSGNPVLDGDGEQIVDTVNPFPESNRMMISEDPASRLGQLPATDLASYEAAVRLLIGQIQAVSALPAHYLGVLTNAPPSADAVRASEASLVARVEDRQRLFSRTWEQVARLMVAVRDGVDPATVPARVLWSPADTRSQAQEADAAQKLYAAGILSRESTLQRLGFSEDEIAREMQRLSNDAQLNSDTALGRYFTGMNSGKGNNNGQ